MPGAQTQEQFRQSGLYSRINRAPKLQNPVGSYAGADVRTQAGIRDQGMYSQLYNVAGPRLHGLGEGVRSPSGLMSQGMYPYLNLAARKKTFGNYLGEAVSATAPGLLVAAGLIIAYFVFFKKDGSKPKSKFEKEVPVEPSRDHAEEFGSDHAGSFYY